jgi:hypothetical protein
MLSSKSGVQSIHTLDPRVGILTFHPDVQEINNNYIKLHQAKLGK